ncbi:histidine phosphatase family protein [Janibacter alkaliphilus]|uniref:Putative phosphomutase (TIGR03848 family) n=1 Tax=Janibacter alkaliphilus TaxID=1069963 RepID=A0A852X6T4_9MICO|nr:putative phosphomutase (TIGR03848 family) [Janibacter alkaliphilus]
MPYCILARHGRSSANTAGVLAGWTPDVALDDTGREQATDLADRLAEVPLVRVVTSPLLRCRQTAEPLLRARGMQDQQHEGLAECRYGAWTGRPLKELAAEPLWRTVQDDPESAAFPPGEEYPAESLRQMYHRAVAAVAEIDAEVAAEHGPHAAWLAVSHGDVIKAVLAEAAGGGLAHLQRQHVDPASVSVVQRREGRSMLLRTNDTGRRLTIAPPEAGRDGDAVVGGGAG